MMEPSLKLVEPAYAHRKAFLATVADYQASGEKRYQPLLIIRADFRGYVRHLRLVARGVGLSPGWVPYTVFWSVKPGLPLVVGELHIRHWLVPASEKEGGHIGYTIAPSLRGKGFGTQQLALGLGKARALLGLDRVLVTCRTGRAPPKRSCWTPVQHSVVDYLTSPYRSCHDHIAQASQHPAHHQ